MTETKTLSLVEPTRWTGASDIIDAKQHCSEILTQIILFFSKRYQLRSWPAGMSFSGKTVTAYWDRDQKEPMGRWVIVLRRGKPALTKYEVLSDELREHEPK